MRTPAIVLATAIAVAMYAHNAAAQPTRIMKCRAQGLPGGPITESGSYVLAQNLRARGDCLVVEADFVTIDLAGFVISGDGTGNGINANPRDTPGAARGIAVRGGTITGFESGIRAFVSSAIIEELRVIDNGDGIGAGSGSIVTGNTVQGNDLDGISTGFASIVTGNTVLLNGRDGIRAGEGSTVTGNTALLNGRDGIAADFGSTVTGNTARGNDSDGIRADVGSTVTGNTARLNGRDGIAAELSNTVTGNTAEGNDRNEIAAGVGSTVTDNTAPFNAVGITATEGSTVSGNTARNNDDIGIGVECPSNVIGNTAIGNAPNLMLEGAGCNNIDNLPP